MVPVCARVLAHSFTSDSTRYPELICCVSGLIAHFSKDHKVLFFENIGCKSSGAGPSKSQPSQYPAGNSQVSGGREADVFWFLADLMTTWVSSSATLLVAVTKTRGKGRIGKEGFNVAHGLKMQSVMAARVGGIHSQEAER